MSETFTHVTYIGSSAAKLWHALTDEEATAAFWGHSNVSDWQEGSRWAHVRTDGSGISDVVGTVLEAHAPHRLVLTFEEPSGTSEDEPPVVAFDIEEFREIVKLTITHTGLEADDMDVVLLGWSSVASNLKTLLETGRVLPTEPWEMHAELREQQMARNDPRG